MRNKEQETCLIFQEHDDDDDDDDKPKGQRDIGRPRKRWRDELHLEDQGTGNMPNPSGT